MLNAFDPQQGHENDGGLRVMALSWHSEGHAITVAYGVPPQPGFCTTPGLLCQWSLSRTTVTPAHPQVRITTDCALQAVACNPHFPSLVTAGNANGGIHVWDLSSEEEDRAEGRSNTATRDIGHQQGVLSMAWVYSTEEGQHHTERAKTFLICSASRYAHAHRCVITSCLREQRPSFTFKARFNFVVAEDTLPLDILAQWLVSHRSMHGSPAILSCLLSFRVNP
jgi:hypothetical protein